MGELRHHPIWKWGKDIYLRNYLKYGYSAVSTKLIPKSASETKQIKSINNKMVKYQ